MIYPKRIGKRAYAFKKLKLIQNKKNLFTLKKEWNIRTGLGSSTHAHRSPVGNLITCPVPTSAKTGSKTFRFSLYYL